MNYLEITDEAEVPRRDYLSGDRAMVVNGSSVAMVDMDSAQAAMDAKVEELRGWIAGRDTYTTLALATAAGETTASVEVTNDPTGSNNGIWVWDGGVLVKSVYDINSIVHSNKRDITAISEVFEIFLEASIFDTTEIGARNELASGSVASSNTFIFETPVANDSFLAGIQFISVDSGTLKIKIFQRSVDTFTQRASFDLNLVAGLNEFNLSDIGLNSVRAGEYLGFYSEGNANYIIGGSNADGYYHTSGDSEVFTDSSVATSSALQVKFVVGAYISSQEEIISKLASNSVLLKLDEIGMFKTGSIGYSESDTIPAGASNTGTLEAVFKTPIPEVGAITGVRGYANSAGTLNIYIRTSDGAATPTLTLEETISVAVPAGSFNVDIAPVAVQAGWFVGFGASGGLTTYDSSPAVPVPVYRNGTAGASNFLADTILEYSFHTAFDFQFDSLAESVQSNELSLYSSDRITICGDSTSTPGYGIRGKGWPHRLSRLCDYNIENFSRGGDTYEGILTRMQSGSSQYGAPFSSYGSTWAILNSGINDDGQFTFSEYQELIRKLIHTVRGFGVNPILATEFMDVFGDEVITTITRSLADQYNVPFVDLRDHARNYGDTTAGPGYYAGFISFVHPGTRMSEITSVPMLEFVRRMPRPNQSLKLFRPLTTPTDETDLAFDTLIERSQLFQEIQIGEQALTVATEQFYDELDINPGDWSKEYIDSEYLSLMTGGTISVDDYLLIDAVLPGTNSTIDSVELQLGAATDDDVTVFVAEVDTATPADGEPMRKYTELTSSYTLTNLSRYMQSDKVAFLVYKFGGFTLDEPKIIWTGTGGKPSSSISPALAAPRGTQLLDETLCGETAELSEWDATEGTVTSVTPVDTPPRGTTKVAVVDGINRLGQTLNLTTLTRDWADEVEVEVVLRLFPAVFDSTDTYPDNSEITYETPDLSVANVGIKVGSYEISHKSAVGLWWTPVKFRTTIPPGSASVVLYIGTSDGSELQVASASVLCVA